MLSFETLLIRTVLAVVVGGIIGAEREYRNKSAGFRTVIVITLGACLFTIFSEFIGAPNNADRIASNILTGIGFIGAGVIFKADDRVKGLTTAAAIWLSAALGMGIGAGYYAASVVGCALTMIVLVTFTVLEGWIDRKNQIRIYKIVCDYNPKQLKIYEHLIHRHNLQYNRGKQCRTGNELTGIWTVRGSEKNHDKFIELILNDEAVKLFEF